MSNKKAGSGPTRKDGKEPMIGEHHSEISVKLRALYDSVQDEEIPARFLDLLESLDEAEKAAKKEKGAERK